LAGDADLRRRHGAPQRVGFRGALRRARHRGRRRGRLAARQAHRSSRRSVAPAERRVPEPPVVTATASDDDKANPGGVQRRPVLWVATSTVLVMALGVGVAWELMQTHTRMPGAVSIAGRFGAPPADKNAVEMSLLSRGVPTSRRQAAPRADRS